MGFSELQSRLGGNISPELLQLALTHSSYAYEKGGENNERLEFLGDSILGYLVAVQVFKDHAPLNEGELTKLKNGVVSAQALATAANRIGLGEFLLLGKAFKLSHEPVIVPFVQVWDRSKFNACGR